MSAPITRITMIKIKEENIAAALKGFETFTKNQKKDGVPYILSMQAGPASGNVKEQGYTFVAKSVFKNQDDMDFYEKNCPAHEEYKLFLKQEAPVSGLMTCIFMPEISYEL